MRGPHILVGVLAVGCGRYGFPNDPPVDASHGDGTTTVDGTPPQPFTITKLTVDAPLLDSPNPGGQDCGIFQVFRGGGDDAMMGADLGAYAAVDASSTIWFAYSCKYADVAWSETIGSWQPPDGVFQRYDGDPGTAGVNELVPTSAIMADGMAGYQLRQLRIVFGPDGTTYGTGERTRPDAVAQILPIHVDQPTHLTAMSYDTAHAGVFDPPALPWTMAAGTGRDLMFDGSLFYLYSSYWDGVTMAATGAEMTSIAVATSTDMVSQTFPTEPMVTGWTEPSVSAWGGSYHMVARDLSTNSYSYIHGTAPDNFDFANAVPLNLASYVGAPGTWDSLDYVEHGLSADPCVTTARVVDGVMYIFYLAGVAPNGGAAQKAESKRGMGVFAMQLPS